MRPISLDDSVSVNPDVVSREVAGELVLLDLESATYFGLNEVGSRIWALVGELGSLRKVCEALEREYAAPQVRIERDVLALVGALRERDLVIMAEGGP